jgi:uncharacterized membrane protein
MKFDWRQEAAQFAAVGVLFGVAIAFWPWTPERMPVHWNLAGEVDRYGGKVEGLLALPLIALGLQGLFAVLPRIDPRRASYEQFADTWLKLRALFTLFMGAVQAIVLYHTFHPEFHGVFAGSAAVGLLFIVLGNWFGKLRPNWFVGIRTPWTLSSRASWAKTHRVGGWVFILSGLLFAATGYTRSPWLLGATLTVLFGGTLGLVIYSYLVWRDDPHREGVEAGPGVS